MSLDVYLERKKWTSYDAGVTFTESIEMEYSRNITHNLWEMAEKAGIYEALWRPYMLKESYNEDCPEDFEQENPTKACEIISLLEKWLKDLKKRPKYFKKFNAENGWGTYEHFVPFVEDYLLACKKYPDCFISVSR